MPYRLGSAGGPDELFDAALSSLRGHPRQAHALAGRAVRLWMGLAMRLAGCMPELIERCEAVQAEAAAQGVRIRWTSGLRTWPEQSSLYAKGRDAAGRILDPHAIVTFAPPGGSWHNFGLAADFVLLRPDGRSVEWSGLADLDLDGVTDWLEVGQLGEGRGLEWGGRWKKLVDLPHLQLTGGLALTAARSLYLTATRQTLEPVWAAVRDRMGVPAALGGGTP